MRFNRKLSFLLVSAVFAGLLIGCSGVEKNTTRTQEGMAMGTVVGGVIGAGAGNASTVGMIPGSLLGASLGMTSGMLATQYYYDEPYAIGDGSGDFEARIQERERRISELEGQIQESEQQKHALMQSHQEMQQEMERLQAGIGDDVQTSTHESGAYKVTMLTDVMFASGSADLTSDGRSALGRAARQIQSQFPDAYIEIRGHTDSEPITYSDWKSNWELSAARAVSVLHYLIDNHNFREQRIRAVGFSDTNPVASNDTAEGRRQNRRAEIVIIPEGSQAARELDIE